MYIAYTSAFATIADGNRTYSKFDVNVIDILQTDIHTIETFHSHNVTNLWWGDNNFLLFEGMNNSKSIDELFLYDPLNNSKEIIFIPLEMIGESIVFPITSDLTLLAIFGKELYIYNIENKSYYPVSPEYFLPHLKLLKRTSGEFWPENCITSQNIN